MTDTLKLLTSLTLTETSGWGMYSASRRVSSSRSSMGVRPAAWTSLSRGSEIFPSGRTGAVRLTASLLHTETWSTSSGPIRYPGISSRAVVGVRAAAALGSGAPAKARMPSTNRVAPIEWCLHASGRAGCDDRTGTTPERPGDRKSTRLNSSHRTISYAVFCLKKKKKKKKNNTMEYHIKQTKRKSIEVMTIQLIQAKQHMRYVQCVTEEQHIDYKSHHLRN